MEFIIGIISELLKYFKTKNHFFNYALDYILIKLKKMTHHVIYNDYERCFEETEVITLKNKKKA